MKVEFYYDSTVPPGSAFPCDNAKAVELIGQLAAKGVNAKAVDSRPAGRVHDVQLGRDGPKARSAPCSARRAPSRKTSGRTSRPPPVREDEDRYPNEESTSANPCASSGTRPALPGDQYADQGIDGEPVQSGRRPTASHRAPDR